MLENNDLLEKQEFTPIDNNDTPDTRTPANPDEGWTKYKSVNYRQHQCDIYSSTTWSGRGNTATYKGVWFTDAQQTATGAEASYVEYLFHQSIDNFLDAGAGDGTIPPNGNSGGDGDDDTVDWSSIWSEMTEMLGSLGSLLGDPMSWIFTFKNLVEKFHKLTGNTDNIWSDMTHSDQRNFIMDIVNKYYNFITAMYQNYYSLEMWRYQQQYNSPLEQAQRLAEAGLFNGFNGQVSSGNAESASGSSTIEPTQGYQDKGSEIAVQRQANSINAISAVFGALGSVASAGSSFASMYSTFSMTPAQRALALETIGKTKEETKSIPLMTVFHGISTIGNLQAAFANIQKDYDLSRNALQTQENIAKWNNTNAWDIASLQSQTSLDVASIGADATVRSARIGASATRYVADTNAATADKDRRQQANQFRVRIISDGLNSAYKWWTETSSTHTSEHYIDASTGKEITEKTAASLGLNYAKIVKAGASFEKGGKYSVGNHDIVKDVRQTKELNPTFFDNGLELVNACSEMLNQDLSEDKQSQLDDIITHINTRFEREKQIAINYFGSNAAEAMYKQLETNLDEVKKDAKKMPRYNASLRKMEYE